MKECCCSRSVKRIESREGLHDGGREYVLLMLWGTGRRRIRLVAGSLDIGDSRHSPKVILVVRRFKKHRIANLLLLFAPMTLQSFPHD